MSTLLASLRDMIANHPMANSASHHMHWYAHGHLILPSPILCLSFKISFIGRGSAASAGGSGAGGGGGGSPHHHDYFWGVSFPLV